MPPAESNSLESAYRDAFRRYADQLERLQSLIDSAPTEAGSFDAGRIEPVLLEVEKARLEHNAARDRLAGALGPQSLAYPGNNETAHRRRIRETARLLWELSGRPDGTAELDWTRAEQLVHLATPA